MLHFLGVLYFGYFSYFVCKDCQITYISIKLVYNNLKKILFQNSAGLVYIKVDFEPKQNKNGPKLFSVHGSNNRTPYADIDLMSKADPLPESESDNNENEEDDFLR